MKKLREDGVGSQQPPKRAKLTRRKLQTDSHTLSTPPLHKSKRKYTPIESHTQKNTELPQSLKTITPPRRKKLIVRKKKTTAKLVVAPVVEPVVELVSAPIVEPAAAPVAEYVVAPIAEYI